MLKTLRLKRSLKRLNSSKRILLNKVNQIQC
jgi:hypothetical protein